MENKSTDALIAELRARTLRREAAEAAAKRNPMFQLRVALLRGNPNKARDVWSPIGKKKRW